jgi:hypothetical protein
MCGAPVRCHNQRGVHHRRAEALEPFGESPSPRRPPGRTGGGGSHASVAGQSAATGGSDRRRAVLALSGRRHRAGVAHLRGRLTADPEPGHLAVVTETGTASGITESTEHIWTALARRHGPSLVLLEHLPAPETGEGGETLDLVRVGADGSPHWAHAWPTPEENPCRAGLELRMAVYGYRIVSRPASAFDRCEDEGGHEPKVAWTSAASRTGT